MDVTKIKATLSALVALLASLSWLSVKFEAVGGWLAANLDNILAVAMVVITFLPSVAKLWQSKSQRVDAAKVETKAAKDANLAP